MSNGKIYRMGRLFGADGKAMIVPVDHGLAYGRIEGLERIQDVVADGMVANCDGFLMSLGAARSTAATRAMGNAPTVLLTMDARLDGLGDNPGTGTIVATVEQAVRLGCHAVKVLMPVSSRPEETVASVAMITEVIRQAEVWDMPVLVEPVATTAPDSDERTKAELDTARMAVELGADILKIRYPGSQETMRRAVEEFGVPIVLLGGPTANSAESVIETTAEAVEAGAAGISIGRQVWQKPPIVRREMIDALVKVVHGKIEPGSAIEQVRRVLC